MAGKRSPILGYNHNVRYRGIVFHIQTEDSGVVNPHVFTHLFHGGVIISTRKLVYDPDANDEAVKALMQAQHKAVMKDLRRATFDDKIDAYLGGTPGLLPREAPAIEAVDAPLPVPSAPAAEAAPAVEPPPPIEPPPDDEPLELTAIPEVGRAPTLESGPHRAPQVAPRLDSVPTLMAPVTDATIPMSILPEPAPERRTRDGSAPPPVRVAFSELEPGRAPTERVPGSSPPPIDPTEPSVRREDVSAAMRAIQVSDEELTAAGLGEAAEIHSPAPPSAPTPPGLVPPPAEGSTYQLGRRATAPEVAGPRPGAPRAAPRPPIPPPRSPTPSGGSAIPTPRSIPPVPPRTATPAKPPPIPNRHPTPPASALPRVPTPAAVPRVTPPSMPPAVRGRPSSGGVVVSRPAVIVGGKGAPTTPPAKVRRARESFGGDLISERSLDEVILAYLSEDTTDE